MIRALCFSRNGTLHRELQPAEFRAALKDRSCVLWVDFEGTPPEEDQAILLDTFGFHPLAVDDALQETHAPKVDDWERYLYIVLEAVSYNGKDGELALNELDVFLGKDYIVTHHDLPIPSLNRLWDATRRHERHIRLGVDHLLYKLIDELVIDYMHVVEEIDEEIEHIEDEVFSRPSNDMVQRIFALKRATMHLRRVLSPMREVLNKLARDDFKVIDARDRIYFRDVYDHLVRLHDITEGLRDLVGGALDTYLSVVNNRMNDIMKVLTIITTLFMPISFITGFFGMNFFQPVAPGLAPWTAISVFAAVMVVMFLLPVGMFIWMKQRRWA
ncbi:MAG: magnesium/cobalt transporter CorA [Chloroflexota bacterium]